MDSRQHQKIRDKVEDIQHEDWKSNKEGKGSQLPKQPSPPSPASPPSPSSPSHDFSFTISLHSSSTTLPDKTKPSPSFALDLAPADDIFFHGHLLPLHLLSHLPVSARSSTNSLDSFTIPITDLIDEQNLNKNSSDCSTTTTTNNNSNESNHFRSRDGETKERIKSRSFSLFGLPRWRKGCEGVEKEDKEKKRKLKFDVSHVLKRYVGLVRPLLFFRRKGENIQLRPQPYSFSGNLRKKNKPWLRGRMGEFSAPASMRTSPTNSGLLVATATLPSSTTDSTMEELQAAIQAAIAHCKNSIAKEEKLKSYD